MILREGREILIKDSFLFHYIATFPFRLDGLERTLLGIGVMHV